MRATKKEVDYSTLDIKVLSRANAHDKSSFVRELQLQG